MTVRPHHSSLLFVVASCVALSGCYISGISPVGTASISYRQVGACNGYGAAAGRPNQAYVIFKIEAVDNSKGNVDLKFYPTRIYVRQSVEQTPEQQGGGWNSTAAARLRFVSEDTKFLSDLGAPGLAAKSFPHNIKTELNGFVVIPVETANANGAAEANQTSYALSYDVTPVEGEADPLVTFAKTNADQTTWPATANCQEIKFQ